MAVLRYGRVLVCLTLVWIWTLIWAIGLSIAFIFWGHRRGFLPRAVRIHSGPVRWICGLDVVMENEAGVYAAEPCIFLANHQSGFDVPLFGAFCPPNLVWIAKKELERLPLIGWVLHRTGNILIDRKNRERAFQQLQEAGQRITEEKRSIAVLPEGTRNSNSRELLPFKRGPFFLAKAAGVPMIPVVCSSLAEVANVRAGKLGGKVRLRVLPPVLPEGTPEQMASQLRELMQKTFEDLNKSLS